jgi:hypothetical protein
MINVTIHLKDAQNSRRKTFYNVVEAYYSVDSECFIVVDVPELKFRMFPRENVISFDYEQLEDSTPKIVSMNGDDNNV